jgi:methionyl-tRNA formyltransferase
VTSAVVFAYHDVGVRCLRVLLDAGVTVPLVVTHADDPKERIWFGSVARLAEDRRLPVVLDPGNEDILAHLEKIHPDFIFSFYYRRMLPPEVLALAKRGAYNMHGSLLPKYRGRVPVNWAVLHGETETGATLHEMTAKPDAGRIVDQEAVPIGPDDTAGEVFRRVTDAAQTVLQRSVSKLIEGTARLRANELSKGSYFGGRRPEDGRIDWSRSAREVHDLVRAVAPPFPGAFTEIGGERVRVLHTRLDPARQPRPGGVGLYRDALQWFADCADGKVLRLLEVEAGPELERRAAKGKKIPL